MYDKNTKFMVLKKIIKYKMSDKKDFALKVKSTKKNLEERVETHRLAVSGLVAGAGKTNGRPVSGWEWGVALW